MLKKQTTQNQNQTKMNEIRVPDNEKQRTKTFSLNNKQSVKIKDQQNLKKITSKNKPQFTDIIPKQSNNLDSFLRIKQSSYKAKEKDVPKFGETVYLPQHLRVDDSNPLIIDYPEFKFHPNDYLLNNTTYFIDYNIFLGCSYIFAAGYNYLVDKHFKTKKYIYIYI